MKKLLLLLMSLTLAAGALGGCSWLMEESSPNETSSSGNAGTSEEGKGDSSSEEKTTYTVTFKQNGETDIVKTVEEGKDLTDVPTPKSKTGYSVVWSVTDFTNISENMTVLAVEKAKKYTVTLDANGGELTANTLEMTYDATYSLPTPTKTGYTFDGWKKGDEAFPASGTWTKDEENVTLTASWTANTYTVRLNADGGELSDTEISVTFGGAYELPTPTKTGYAFGGWKKGDEAFSASGTWATEGSVDLTASWTANTYTVRLNADGGELSNTEISVTFDGAYELPTPTKSGYIFLGWKKSDGTTFPSTGTWKTAGDLALTAAWSEASPDTWTITFVQPDQEPKLVTVNKGEALAESQIPTPVSKVGYTVVWESFDRENITSDMTVRTVETAKTYTVTFDGATVQAVEVAYDAEYALPTPEKEGYDFGGWYNGENKVENSGSKWQIDNDALTLTAKWTARSYTVRLNANGGDLSQETLPVTFGASYELPTPTKTGYTFGGWKYGDSSVALKGEWAIGSEANGATVALTASWTANSSTVTFVGAELSQQTLTYDSAYELPTPTKTGYTFIAWKEGENVIPQKGTWKKVGNVTLTAEWSANTYTVTLNLEGGTGATSYTATYGEAYALPQPTKEGYTFGGWKKGNEAFSKEGTWTITENVTLTATWVEISDESNWTSYY